MEDAAKDYAAGFAAGVATVLIGHPFDTVKVKLQTQNTEVNTTKYRSAAQCFLGILKLEGVKGIYRGATSSFVGVALESSVLFGAYSQLRSALQALMLNYLAWWVIDGRDERAANQSFFRSYQQLR